jgi:hypothetical protein
MAKSTRELPPAEDLNKVISYLEERGFSKDKFKQMWDDTNIYYGPELIRMQMLDAVDKGRLWQALNVTMPDYQLLPDTNHVAQTKLGLLASIYCVPKGATIMPTSETDKDLIANINTFLSLEWQRNNVGYYQFLAGERCALMNIGITQVGWDNNILGGSGINGYSGQLSLKNINPMKFRRDPFATSLDTASYCFPYDVFHETLILSSKMYKARYEEYKKDTSNFQDNIVMSLGLQQLGQAPVTNAKDYHVIHTFFVRDEDMIHEIHVIDLTFILAAKLDIKPSMYPFAISYCNAPAEDLIGVSECAKIFSNTVVNNIMDSILFTAEYKNQRPPKFVNANSGINLATFIKHGDEAERTYIVNGDASKAVHYHQFPTPSNIVPQLQERLVRAMQGVTGVDDRYMGRNTGSITTTGGVENMLSRVTLIDTPKIQLYEMYAKQLTKLILYNYLTHEKKRSLYYQDKRTKKWKTVNVELEKLDPETLLNYEIDISSELPHSKQRVEAIALQLMEKQLQYKQAGQAVDFITPEELLMFIDLGPMAEYMLDRMGVQRQADALADVAETLTAYTNLLQTGMDPEQAMMQTAALKQQMRNGVQPEQVQPADNFTPEGPSVGQSPQI